MDDFPQSPSKRARFDTHEDNDMQLDDPDDFYDDDDNSRSLNRVDPGSVSHGPQADSAYGISPSINTATAASALPDSHVSAPELRPDNIDSVTSPAGKESALHAPVEEPDKVEANTSAHTQSLLANGAPSSQQGLTMKPTVDAQFLEAARQNKTDENAEWRYDSSDAESSSDDSSDTSSDDDDSEDSDDEDEGILLDPAEAARMLMKEEGGEDGDGDKVAKGPIKTQNELDANFSKPDITITPDMTVVELGVIDNIISNLALVKANTSGEYRVLESGSLLCLEDRRVVGEVFEPLGRVHNPMYSVGFAQRADIDELGIARGTTVYYVEQHSTYVFTQAIQQIKGSDASNMHDEEVFGEEVEFSDDEAEAEYKRNLKQARQAKRAAAQGIQPGVAPATSANGHHPRSNNHAPPVQEASYPTAISYDDDDGEDMYKPLARPDNLSQMMGASRPSLERRSHDISRGAFNGRGRGDRGRGRGRGRGDRSARGGSFNRGRGDRSQGYSRDQRNGSHSTQQSHDTKSSPKQQQQQQQQQQHQQQQSAYPLIPQVWSHNASLNLPQNFPPPPPPPAVFAQQAQAMQQQSFNPQAWVQYFQQHAAQATQQQQQQHAQQPHNESSYSTGQASGQGGQPDLSSLMRSLSQGGNRQA